ncbi:peptidoglycan DD-metalloendopeptidase family protein [Thalassotalea litorea]|uniref:peptidoglycan DD-metalloendopeptidase family protein n=1 Tax=Thalassotalea litorea TaxID=2020715 RepID=UPI001FE586E6|nr:peptidoglycan DD-metalloendopeptidase family protein [Thalassotalea litorea]
MLLKKEVTALLIGVTLLLTACAERIKPAEVVSIGGSKPTLQKQKNTLSGKSHQVQAGETLYSIAWRSGNDVNTLAALNGLVSPYRIYPGQTIRLQGANPPKKVASVPKSRTNKVETKTVTKNPQKTQSKVVANQNSKEYVKKSDEKITNIKVPSISSKVSSWRWPAKGQVISGFSSAKQGNKGIDIAGVKGQEVTASADGLIVYSGNALRGYGNLIIIKHNDDYLSAYAHNDTLLVQEQQNVRAGQVIAKMGNSGTDKTMLHFEIRFRGKSVNPARYLPKR